MTKTQYNTVTRNFQDTTVRIEFDKNFEKGFQYLLLRREVSFLSLYSKRDLSGESPISDRKDENGE